MLRFQAPQDRPRRWMFRIRIGSGADFEAGAVSYLMTIGSVNGIIHLRGRIYAYMKVERTTQLLFPFGYQIISFLNS